MKRNEITKSFWQCLESLLSRWVFFFFSVVAAEAGMLGCQGRLSDTQLSWFLTTPPPALCFIFLNSKVAKTSWKLLHLICSVRAGDPDSS